MKEKSKKKNKLGKWPYIFVAPFLISYLAFYLYPMLYSFAISFTDWTAVKMNDRQFLGLQNYIRVFTADPLFLEFYFKYRENHDYRHASYHCGRPFGGCADV